VGVRFRGNVTAQYPVVIVAARKLELVIGCVDALSNRVRRCEVHRRAEHREDAPVGQGLRICPRELVRVDLRLVIEYALRRPTLEVEVGVVREVADRVRVTDSTIGDVECVIVRETIGDLCLEIARVAALSVGTDRGELYAAVHDLRRPEMIVQPLCAAMDVVLLV